jgi:hypothetical protein
MLAPSKKNMHSSERLLIQLNAGMHNGKPEAQFGKAQRWNNVSRKMSKRKSTDLQTKNTKEQKSKKVQNYHLF